MQQPSELVGIFPEAGSTVKKLIRECEEWLAEYANNEQQIREFLSQKVSMFDIDICTKLAIITKYGNEKEEHEAQLGRLKRLYYLYYPPKDGGDSLTHADVERAKEYPIRELIPVKANKALCVWHDDHHPSMHIYKDNRAHCFSCSQGGDSIAVAMQMQGLGFKDAVKWLNSL